ncbi:hypothetical protein GJ633_05955 [Halorubrum sp. CBA1125]|uniref:hypothetical protein n=1 Tax=Halorubrum sp. CBA1125 TaxID=2668072 RepID=UPI0012E7CA84|nr:hypothetical protein [Halorubrum sp. CBA1125]MUW14252.1 hypothetical protein [Halorubrum sp. CBA1125]
MADSWEADGPSPVDADTFQEWVRYTADSRDIDEQELLNQLVSAFWVLDEMTDVVPAAETGTGSGRHRSGDESGGDTRSGHGSDSRNGSEAQSETSADADEFEPEPTGHDADRNPTETDSDAPVSTEDSVAAEIQALRNSLHTELNLMQTVTELRRQVSDLSIDVEQQRSRQDNFTDRISDDLTRLHSRVESIDSQTSERDDALETRLADLEESIDEFESTHREFETWIDGEFDEIEGLFERLIDTTDRLDDRLADVESTLDTVAARDRRLDGLASLRQEAIDAGVSRGRCERCDTHVDLSMLTEPVCPGCNETFTGVDPVASWNLFSNATIRTRPSSPASNDRS